MSQGRGINQQDSHRKEYERASIKVHDRIETAREASNEAREDYLAMLRVNPDAPRPRDEDVARWWPLAEGEPKW